MADDLSLLSNESTDLQTLLNISQDYANKEQYSYNPLKSEIANLGNADVEREVGYINSEPIFYGSSVTHLGIKHSNEKPTSNTFVINKISLLYKVTYSLMGTGFHGWNGIGPESAIHIYNCYVLPRFMYGMCVMSLSTQQIDKLESAHRSILRQIQCLPKRTAKAAIYLLIGALPFEALLNLSQLSLLNNIIFSNNPTMVNLLTRQIATKSFQSKSWFINICKILNKYKLPTLSQLLCISSSKITMKNMFKKAVHEYWSNQLKEECYGKITVAYINIESLSTRQCHPVWRTVNSNLYDIQRATVKVKLLTDTYVLQKHIHKFSRSENDDLCNLCLLETEDREHFLLNCSALFEVREIWLKKIKEYIIQKAGSKTWCYVRENDSMLMTLLLDCSSLQSKIDGLVKEDFAELECLSRIYCYKLRSQLLQQLLEKKQGDSRISKYLIPYKTHKHNEKNLHHRLMGHQKKHVQ